MREIDALLEKRGRGEEGGQEHDVYYPENEGGRVIKITLDKPLFPSEYLDRHLFANAILGDAVEIEGVFVRPNGRIGIMVSQPWRDGPPPSDTEVACAMEKAGFVCIGEDSFAGHGLTVTDAGPKNWIKDPESGLLMPIDLRIFRAA